MEDFGNAALKATSAEDNKQVALASIAVRLEQPIPQSSEAQPQQKYSKHPYCQMKVLRILLWVPSSNPKAKYQQDLVLKA